MKTLLQIAEESVPLSRKQGLFLLIITACFFQLVLFYSPAIADEAVKRSQETANPIINESVANITEEDANKHLALATTEEISKKQEPQIRVISSSVHSMTAYNSEVGQTDDSPCITANGFNVCEHGIEDTIAANFLKFGTKVRIPELFGDRIFVVRDRMNKRYTERVDVWMLNRSDAIQFGIKRATIEVIEVIEPEDVDVVIGRI